MNDKPKTGSGRLPPPLEHRFLKGSSGNKRGRPKGSIDLKRVTRKVALKKHRLVINGRAVRKTLLELVIEQVVRGAASGAPSMVSLYDKIRTKVRPIEGQQMGGLLLVPEPLSEEEWIAQAERRNAVAQNPETYVNHKSEEFYKAMRGIPTPLGEAMLAVHRRWE
jgi:uncharacterized protein DUF5681